MSSSSQMRSCATSSAWPSMVASNVSSPSRLVKEGQMVAGDRQTQTCISPGLITILPCHQTHVKKKTRKTNFVTTNISIPPVALAMRLRSLFRTLLTAMAPTSTKYLRHMSSTPPVVRMTLAPDARIFWILSLVMSDSLRQQNPVLSRNTHVTKWNS